MAVINSLSPRPISTGSKKGASRPWIRYVIGSSSSGTEAPYTSDRMRTSSFRLLVASMRSRFAASSANFMPAQLSQDQAAGGAAKLRLATSPTANYHMSTAGGHRQSAVLIWGATNQEWRG